MNRLALLTISLLVFPFVSDAQTDSSIIMKVEITIVQGSKPSTEWTPSKANVEKALLLSYEYLQQCARDTSPSNYYRRGCQEIMAKLPDYHVECFGRFNEGQRLIDLRFISTSNWSRNSDTSRTVAVMGGGSDYWNIEIDLQNRKCVDFWINAPE